VRASDALGRYGEDLAAQRLETSGHEILTRNWRCKDGEIDVVAREGATLVVCEVKTRAGLTFGSPLEAVTPTKLARLRGLALRWLEQETPTWVGSIRIDVIGVLYPPGGTPTVEHIRDVVP
jgi:putative endonuclease